MATFQEYLDTIEEPAHKEKLTEVLQWVEEEFPELGTRIAWNQPMFTHHETFIIGFSTAKKHFAVAPEHAGIVKFAEKIEAAGYTYTNQLFRIQWNQPVNYALLKEIIAFNITDKAEYTTFWRKENKK
ncbi:MULTISPECIES: iron chaperone [unclassified Enterococcus]|jgi:uncharacterized protein YdhG (YjbR/CyaY superfamily)|uniref:iron chaperone n=1 Tax=unclassified Enterococcus TaxID=2608891 RepID=UPI003D2D4A91